VAASSNTTWLKGFSGNPDGVAREDGTFVSLVGAIGTERVAHPLGGDDAVEMTRCEALARVLWTRAVADGDMTAIKLLVELLECKGGEATADRLLNADMLAEAGKALLDWSAERTAAGSAGDGQEVRDGEDGNGGTGA
jgi:hypothetical protein